MTSMSLPVASGPPPLFNSGNRAAPNSHPATPSCSSFRTEAHVRFWPPRPRLATMATPISPTGTPTRAASLVTVVGSMSRLTLGNEDVGTGGDVGSEDVREPQRSSPLRVEHQVNSTGLLSPPTTPEEESNVNPIEARTSRARRHITPATSSTSVPMRRSVALKGKHVRRKRRAIIPSAAATNAATRAIARAAEAVKAAERVPSPPPSIRHSTTTQQRLSSRLQRQRQTQQQQQQSPRPLQEAQLPEVDEEAASSTQPLSELQSELDNTHEIYPESQPEPLSPPKPLSRKKWLPRQSVMGTQSQECHFHLNLCVHRPVKSCYGVAQAGSVFCKEHLCKGLNLDHESCGGEVRHRQKSMFCERGYHPEAGEGMARVLNAKMATGQRNAHISRRQRELRRQEVLQDFDDKFGEILESPLVKPKASHPAVPPVTFATASTTNPPGAEPRVHRYQAFMKPQAPWGSGSVDKWWEGTWSYHVLVPAELQLRADIRHYRQLQGRQSYHASTSTTCSPLSVLEDQSAEPLLEQYSGRFRSSAGWQPALPPPGLTRCRSAP